MSSLNTDVIKEQAFAGYPSLLPQVCEIHPKTLGEIVQMGSTNYNQKVAVLLLTEVEICKIIKEKTQKSVPVENIKILSFLLGSAAQDDMFLLELQECFDTFIKEEVLLLPKINSIVVGDPKEKRLITDDNFSDFQEILKIQNARKIDNKPPENESEIARKFRLRAEQRDAIKRKQANKDGTEQKLVDLLEVAEVFNIDYKNKTLPAFYNLIQRHQLKEKWEQDIQMLCAGADSKKLKTKYWGESLETK